MIQKSFNQDWLVGSKGRFFGMDTPRETTAVELPHDAMIARPRSADAPAGNKKGFWPDGVYEYTKTFDVPEQWADQRVYLEFEGVYRDAEVLINGDCVANHPYGYTGFIVRADAYLRYGQANDIGVTVRSADDSRWYSGTGIYRPVHLYVGGLVHLPPHAVRVSTPEITPDVAVVSTETLVRNDSHRRVTVLVRTELLDADDQVRAADETPFTLFAGDEATLRRRLPLETPQLWDLENPALYTCRTTLLLDGEPVDTAETRFGVRSLGLDSKRGFCLNGKTVKMRGACIHHDNGPLGAATFAAAEWRRVRLLKEAGFNAIRMAHHPASVALLEACDAQGVLVMDEAFDMWGISKSDFDYGNRFMDWWQRDICAMVTKDFNHPSVVLYSIGNEIPDTGSRRAALGGANWRTRYARRTTRAIPSTASMACCVCSMRSRPCERRPRAM